LNFENFIVVLMFRK